MTPLPGRKRRVRIFLAAAGVAVLLFGMAAAGLIFYAHWKLSHLPLGGRGESFSTRFYSAPFWLGTGFRISALRLMGRLHRLDYRMVEGTPEAVGQYAWDPPILSVYLRGFDLPSLRQDPALVRLVSESENRWTLAAPDGSLLPGIALEPELIGELSGPKKTRREPATWEEIPAHLKNAVVSIEDRRFYSHFGLDPRAILRAAWVNLTRRGGLQGGSTLTQQLAKNLILSPRRTFRRKIAEAALALYLERRYTKQEILTLYLNHIYLGQDGPVSVAGVKSAAGYFFGKPVSDLSLAECATLAGEISRPAYYNPIRNPESAVRRRNFVLRRMRLEGMITDRQLEESLAEPLKTRPPAEKGYPNQNAYVMAESIRQLSSRYSEEELYHYGLAIHTTVDPLLQSAAHRAIQSASRQAALIAMDPLSGRILALAGGKNYGQSQFNRATQARRQPGSAFKPFVYGAALEQGFTLAALLSDTQRVYSTGLLDGSSDTWAPKNFDGVYYGTTMIRPALALSMNSATLDLAERIGPGRIVRFARKLGIQSPLEPSLAMALGSSEVTLLELTAAYAPFDNGGFSVKPNLVESVYDADGHLIESSAPERRQVLDTALAGLMTSLLESVVQEGTARGLGRLGWTGPVAGKTGTTNDGRDAWFIGYTPDLLAGVWAGDDRNIRINATGAKNAMPIWAEFMKESLADRPPTPFPGFQDLVRATIDPLSGLLAVSGCPERRPELFLAGTAPTRSCPLHRGGLGGWLRRIFGKD